MSQEIVKKGSGGARRGAGRPRKIVEEMAHSVLLELFDAEAERKVIRAMIDRAQSRIADGPAVQAATWLWDRKYGKVTEKTESHHTIDVTRLSDDELERLAKGG
ncbi:MAG TPA: hypothetical protein VEF04_23535 [Blastocatellia bacterium]|nr:hypothetical protein [Blastocatellia bacterium]